MHVIQKRIVRLAKQEDLEQYGYRRLGEKIGVAHPQQVKWHLQKLINDGALVRRADGTLRAAAVSPVTSRLAKLPILGQANCGEALSFADGHAHDYLTLSPTLIKSRHFDRLFAVRAVGDSMNACSVNGQPIEEGDYVIVDSSTEVPETGDYVVASVEGLANIKRYVRREDEQLIALVSESQSPRPPMIFATDDLDALRIHGKVVQVVKTPALI